MLVYSTIAFDKIHSNCFKSYVQKCMTCYICFSSKGYLKNVVLRLDFSVFFFCMKVRVFLRYYRKTASHFNVNHVKHDMKWHFHHRLKYFDSYHIIILIQKYQTRSFIGDS